MQMHKPQCESDKFVFHNSRIEGEYLVSLPGMRFEVVVLLSLIHCLLLLCLSSTAIGV